MDSAREKRFYDALGVVPDVPDSVFAGIERNVRQSGVKRRTALAACLLLAFIIPTLLIWHLGESNACAEEYVSIDELFYALEFLSGNWDSGELFDVCAEAAIADYDTVDPQVLAAQSDSNRHSINATVSAARGGRVDEK